MVRVGSLFSGIGGLELGLEQALRDHGFNARTVFQVEKDDYCKRVLARHWPDAIRYDDVCALKGSTVGQCDILCGGFPCQDVSIAGKGAGLKGARSGLWYEFSRLIREIRPRVVVVENVAAIRHPDRGGAEVLGCLAEGGYDALWFSLRASDVGAPHQRERVFFVGWMANVGARGHHGDGSDARWAQGADGASNGGEVMGNPSRGGTSAAEQRGLVRGALAPGEELVNPSRDRWGSSGHDRRGASDGASQEYPANARGARLEGYRDISERTRAEHARSRSVRGGRAQSRLGRAAHGLSEPLDAHTFPARPHEPQHPSEAQRVTTEKEGRAMRLKALGNAVVPQCGYVVGCVVAELMTRMDMYMDHGATCEQ